MMILSGAVHIEDRRWVEEQIATDRQRGTWTDSSVNEMCASKMEQCVGYRVGGSLH